MVHRKTNLKKNKPLRPINRDELDSLTGLPTRELFIDRLNQALTQAKRNQHMLGLLHLKIGNLNSSKGPFPKEIKKPFLLETVARLKTCMRKSDTLAYLENKEFVVILPKISKSLDAALVSRKIITSLARPFSFESDRKLSIQANIGISLYPYNSNQVENLLKNAETAMQNAEEIGSNHFQFYTSEHTDLAFDRAKTEERLLKAVKQKELILHYEPQVDLKSGKIIAMKAYPCWQHPSLGLIFPREFIQLAEDTGLILQIGEWALLTACKQNKAWQNAGYPPMRVAVSLSDMQIKRQVLIDIIDKALEKTGLDPKYLELELTESIIMKNEGAISLLFQKIRDMGIYISVDSFGTGYSSLSHLKRLPINRLKIDQTFVRSITESSDEKSISAAIIAVAHNFDLKVIANGVQTDEQLKCLQSLKCDEVQGLSLSRQLPAEVVSRLLSKVKASGKTNIAEVLGIEKK